MKSSPKPPPPPTYITQAKYDAFQKQLQYMEKEGIVKLSKLLAAAPGSGMGRPLDLPIHDKARQFYAEIDEIKAKLNSAVIIDEYIKNIKQTDTVDIGARVTLVDVETKEIDSYYLLGSDESDPSSGRISFLSPLGKELLGKKRGDIASLASGYKARIETIEYAPFNFKYTPFDWEASLNNTAV